MEGMGSHRVRVEGRVVREAGWVVFFTAMVFLLAGIMIADIWLLVWWLS